MYSRAQLRATVQPTAAHLHALRSRPGAPSTERAQPPPSLMPASSPWPRRASLVVDAVLGAVKLFHLEAVLLEEADELLLVDVIFLLF